MDDDFDLAIPNNSDLGLPSPNGLPTATFDSADVKLDIASTADAIQHLGSGAATAALAQSSCAASAGSATSSVVPAATTSAASTRNGVVSVCAPLSKGAAASMIPMEEGDEAALGPLRKAAPTRRAISSTRARLSAKSLNLLGFRSKAPPAAGAFLAGTREAADAPPPAPPEGRTAAFDRQLQWLNSVIPSGKAHESKEQLAHSAGEALASDLSGALWKYSTWRLGPIEVLRKHDVWMQQGSLWCTMSGAGKAPVEIPIAQARSVDAFESDGRLVIVMKTDEAHVFRFYSRRELQRWAEGLNSARIGRGPGVPIYGEEDDRPSWAEPRAASELAKIPTGSRRSVYTN